MLSIRDNSGLRHDNPRAVDKEALGGGHRGTHARANAHAHAVCGLQVHHGGHLLYGMCRRC